MTTSREMVEMLRRHYLPETKPPGGIFAPEIAAPNHDRRADLIWQGTTAAYGTDLIGHEIKVTRRDLQVELDDPTKSDAWMRYCDRWWLVVPDPALIEGLDLPPQWGCMAPPSGRRKRSMTVLWPAPKLKPYPQAPAYRRLASWLDYQRQKQLGDVSFQVRSLQQDLEWERRRVRDLEQKLLAGEGERYTAPKVEMARKIIDAVGMNSSGELGDWHAEIKIEEVVEALLDIKAARAHEEDIKTSSKMAVERAQAAYKSLGLLLERHGSELRAVHPK